MTGGSLASRAGRVIGAVATVTIFGLLAVLMILLLLKAIIAAWA